MDLFLKLVFIETVNRGTSYVAIGLEVRPLINLDVNNCPDSAHRRWLD